MEKRTLDCLICRKAESDCEKMITCMYCFSSFHLKCKNIHAKAKKHNFLCTSKCAEFFQRILEMSNTKSSMISQVSTELKSTTDQVVSEMRTIKTEVNAVITAVEKSQDYLSSKFDIIVSEFKTLKAENEYLKQQIDELKRDQTLLKASVQKMERSVESADKEAVCNNAMIFGLPCTSGENLTGMVHKVFSKIDASLNDKSLVSVTRLYKPNKPNTMVPIRVVFNSKAVKEHVLKKKKELGELLSTSIDESLVSEGKSTFVVIREELTPSTIKLLKEIRAVQHKVNLKFVWPGKNGDIYVKQNENSKPRVIQSHEDFASFMEMLGK